MPHMQVVAPQRNAQARTPTGVLLTSVPFRVGVFSMLASALAAGAATLAFRAGWYWPALICGWAASLPEQAALVLLVVYACLDDLRFRLRARQYVVGVLVGLLLLPLLAVILFVVAVRR